MEPQLEPQLEPLRPGPGGPVAGALPGGGSGVSRYGAGVCVDLAAAGGGGGWRGWRGGGWRWNPVKVLGSIADIG